MPAGAGVSAATLESDLFLQPGSLSNLGNGTALIGSAITQNVSLFGGMTLSFDWDFLTNQAYNDGTFNVPPSKNNDDYAFMTLLPVNAASLTKLADVFTPNTITSSSNNPFIGETGFQTFSVTVPSTGGYLLVFGVVHAMGTTDDGINSGLLIDNVKAVPEPAPCLVLFGLCAAGLLRRRNRRS